jgi:hypothetical protein
MYIVSAIKKSNATFSLKAMLVKQKNTFQRVDVLAELVERTEKYWVLCWCLLSVQCVEVSHQS